MKKLILIGYMGAGKTTVGLELAKQFSIPFWDTDSDIEEKQGRSISDIFAKEGEDYFRELETEYLKELLEKEEAGILSTGGGLPLRKRNRELFKAMGKVVYLQVSAKTVLERLKEDVNRPLLQVENREERITEMLAKRHPVYREAADIIIHADGCKTDEIVKEIISRFCNDCKNTDDIEKNSGNNVDASPQK